MNVVELAPEMTVGFRDGTPEDQPFIYNSWLRHHHDFGEWPRRLGIERCAWDAQDNMPFSLPCPCCRFSHRRYYDEHKKVIARLLERSKVLVACNPNNEGQILGYLVYEPGVLHWVYVKEPFRWDPTAKSNDNPRVGRALMERVFGEPWEKATLYDIGDFHVTCSHWTRSAERLADGWNLVYRPFLLEER